MIFRDAVGALGIGVGGRVGMFRAGERKNDSGVVAAQWGKLVGLIPCPDFEAGPLAPGGDAGGGLDDIGKIGPPGPGGDFDEIKFTLSVGAEEHAVKDPPQAPTPSPRIQTELSDS